MALLVANYQWPNSTSPNNYSNDASDLITAVKNYEMTPATATWPYQTVNGDQWGLGNTCRNPSYQSPNYYEAYANFMPDQSDFWLNAKQASYDLINTNAHPTTGLVSNWSDPSGTPNSCNGPDEFGWDACRNPWRMGIAAAWYSHADAQAICDKIANFVNNTGVANLKGPLPQDGSTGSYHSPTFISTWAVGVMGSNSSFQSTLDAIYTETVAISDPLPYYFGNTLRALSLFAMTGNFWNPQTIPLANTPPIANATADNYSGFYPPL